MEQSRIFHFVARIKFQCTIVRHMMMLVSSVKVVFKNNNYCSFLLYFNINLRYFN